jgi:hypothetical protein
VSLVLGRDRPDRIERNLAGVSGAMGGLREGIARLGKNLAVIKAGIFLR